MVLSTGTTDDGRRAEKTVHYSPTEEFDMRFQTLLSSDPVIWWQFDEIEVDEVEA